MRAFVLRALALSVITFSATAALSQPVSDLFRHEVCSPPLRGFYQKRISEIRIQDAQDLVRFDWCKADVGSEREAREQGFDLDLLYESLDIEMTSRDKWRKAKDWMIVNCGNYRSDSAEKNASARYEEVMDSDVAKQALVTFEHCVNGPEYGIECRADNYPGSSTTAMLYLRYRSPDAARRAPIVTSSKVEGGHVISAPAGQQWVFRKGTVIPPQGITALAVRSNTNSEVMFEVSLDRGFPNCSKVVRGGPLSTVIVTNLSVTGDRMIPKVFSAMDTVAHRNCSDEILPDLITVRPEPGYSLDLGSATYQSAVNPHMTAMPFPPPPQYQDCWSVLQGKATVNLTPEGHAAVTVYVHQCPREIGHFLLDPYFRVACHWAQRPDYGGGGNGTRVEVNVTGRKVESNTVTRRIDPIADKTPRDSPVEIDLPAVEADLTNLRVSFDVVVIDKVSNTSYSLSDNKPSDRGALAAVDMGQRKLKISLPQQVEPSYLFEGMPDETELSDEGADAKQSHVPPEVAEFAASEEGIALIRAFSRIGDLEVRERIVTLVKSLGEHDR